MHATLVVGVSQTAALNRGRHLYSAGRPLRWALARILVLFHFMVEPRAEIRKIGWATDGGGAGMKFFKKFILTRNHC